jgi:hypothetical protein
MATTEHARHRLYQRLNELIGSDEADTLMELLPPTGWADVATKHDLAHQTEVLNARFDRLDEKIDVHAQLAEARLMTEIAGLRTELHQSLRINMLVTVGVLGTLITVVGALT